MSVLQSEALLLCLAASLLWAPLVYLSASILDRNQTLKVSEKIWLAALAAAVLPVVLAPALSSAGISLRPIMPIPVPIVEEVTYAAPAKEAPAPIAAPVETFTAVTTTETVETVATKEAFAAPQISGEMILKMIGLLYVYGAALAFGLWLMRSLGFALNVARARPVNDPTLFAVVDEWRDQMGARKPLRLKSSDRISSVCVYGYFRPVILIPANIRDRVSFEDLVIMCAHELAHIKRGDVRVFAIGAAARILFWFNPFIKRITAQAELAAEQGADALVVQNGVNRRAYAACFVEGLRFAARRPAQAFAALPSFTPFDRKGRRKRLDSILSGTRETTLPVRTKLMLGAAGVVAASAVFVQAAVAVHPQASIDDDPILTQLPVDGKVTLAHGVQWKDKKSGEIKPPHKGVDIAAKRGSPVMAPGDGKVVEATDLYKGKKSWGKVIVIDHGNGMKTRYAHLDSYAVMKGDRVWTGDVIGKVGETGEVTGPHLHFETIIDGETVDPLMVLGFNDVPTPTKPAIAPEPKVAPDPVVDIDIDPVIAPDPAPAPQPIKECCADSELVGGDYKYGEFEFSADVIGNAFADAREAMADAWEDRSDAMEEAWEAREEAWEAALEAREEAMEEAREVAEEAAEAMREAGLASATNVRIHTANGVLSFNGGEVLSQRQRAEMERSLDQMRREMKAAREGRAKAREAARHSHYKAKQKEKQRYYAEKQQRQEQGMSDNYEYKFEHEKQVLKMRDQSLEDARRMIAQAERNIKQQMRQAENDLRNSERSMRLAKLPKKDVESFKQDIEEARRDLKEHKKERLAELREAEKTIEEQQREIERLRAELAAKE